MNTTPRAELAQITALIERAKEQRDRDAAEHCPAEIIALQDEVIAGLEALQGEVERLKRDVACHDDMSNEIAYLRKERDALAAKLDELQRQEPEPEWVIYQPCGKHIGIGWHNVASVNVRVPKYLCPICKPPSQHGITKGTPT